MSPEAANVRAKFSLRQARASRRELHHKSQAAARDARAVLAKARAYKERPDAQIAEAAAAYDNHNGLYLDQKRLGGCHRIWTALTAFLEGRPLRAVEPRSARPWTKPRPYGAVTLAQTLLEVAEDPELRVDRKKPIAVWAGSGTSIGQSELYLQAERALRVWLDAK